MKKLDKNIVALYKKHGSLKAIHRALGISFHKVRKAYLKSVDRGDMHPLPVGRKGRDEQKIPEAKPEGRVKPIELTKRSLPPAGMVKRYILTSAQNDTTMHDGAWRSLCALQDHYAIQDDAYSCEIMVARFTYMKAGLGASGDKHKFTTRKNFAGGGRTLTWDPIIDPYLVDERVEIANDLIWHGEMNIIPTAQNPLSGMEVYAGQKSSIFPHVKIAMRSVPHITRGKVKFCYTTGTVTQRNYIQRKTGQKAEFHHCYGALLVEVDSNGSWWCRQLNSDSDGVIYDLDLKVDGDKVTSGHRPSAIYWSDLHASEIDDDAFNTAFSFTSGGMLDTLKPHRQYIGDIMSFKALGHHDNRDAHTMYRRHMQGWGDLRTEIEATAGYMSRVYRDWCDTYVVRSNHDDHLARWLSEINGLRNSVNAKIWLELNQAMLHMIDEGEEWNPVCLALQSETMIQDVSYCVRSSLKWLDYQPHVICEDVGGGIEMGMHGHRGARGSRGSPQGFARMGRKACVGHFHSAQIIDGVYVAGTFSRNDLDWTTGPSDWSCSHVLVYPNGKRAIVTFWDNKWRSSSA